MQKNMRSKLTRVFAAVFCVLTLISCSIDARLENKELNWAVEPTFSGAWAFSNHAGLTLDDFSTARFIGSDGEALFLDLHLDLSDCVGDDEDASRQWSTQHFVSGVFKNPQFELSRSGKISETTERNYTIKGNSVRIGQLYVQAVETNNGILDTYYGVMNAQGEWIEEPVFCDFAVLPQGCCWLQYGGSSPYTVMITSEGKINRIPQTLYLSSRSAISDADAEDPWYAMHDIYKENCYVDQYGEIRLRCPYGYCENFSEGLAVIMSGGKYGYIDRNGKIAISPQFGYAQPFSEGVATVRETSNDGCWLINTNGDAVLETDYDGIGMFKDGLAICIRNGKWGIMDRSGKEIVKPKYQFVTKIDSCYLLSQGEKYGLYLPVCSKVIQPKYSEISYSSGNCAIVRENDKYGLLDIETGEIVIEPCYLEMRYFGEGTILVSKRPGCYGIIANNGDTIVPADGTYRVNPNEGFGDALVPICEDNNWGYIINPLIYSEWNSDVTKRAASLGLELNGQDCSCGDFLGLAYNVLLRYMEWTGNRGTLTDGNIPESCEGLQQLLNVSNLQEAEPISRQQAAFVLAQMAKQCGNVTEYYTNYCGDAAEVDTQYAPAVAYISSLGVFDIQDNLFMPTQILDGREAVSVMALFLEELLDTESSFGWSVDGEMVKINDLATSTISLEAPSSLSACWW